MASDLTAFPDFFRGICSHSSGLDAVSSMSVARALLSIARSGRTVACVVHQPSSKLYTTADDVIVLANGRTLYAGSVTDVPMALGRAGFVCPQYYNVADYCELISNFYKTYDDMIPDVLLLLKLSIRISFLTLKLYKANNKLSAAYNFLLASTKDVGLND